MAEVRVGVLTDERREPRYEVHASTLLSLSSHAVQYRFFYSRFPVPVLRSHRSLNGSVPLQAGRVLFFLHLPRVFFGDELPLYP